MGHIIGEGGVKPDPKKLQLLAVKEFPRPKKAKNVSQFLGLAGYYRRFIPGFLKLAKPFTELLKKKVASKWNVPHEEAFVVVRDTLCEKPVLQYPDFNQSST